jgi:hypothetical protein
VPTLGDYNVMVRQVVSSIVNVVSTSGSSPSAIAQAVWADPTVVSITSSLDFISGSTTYLSSSMAQLSASNEIVYSGMMEMSSSISFVSSSVDYLSSSMAQVSSSNVQVYDTMLILSQSIATISGSSPEVIAQAVLDAYVDGDTVKDTLNNIDNKVIDVVAVNQTILSGSNLLIQQNQSILNECLKLLKVQQGRWKIADNHMIIYDQDNQTPLFRFALYDENGNPTSGAAFERMPVSIT